MSIRIGLIDENIFQSILTASALGNIGFEVVDVVNDWSRAIESIMQNKPDALILSIDSHADHAIVIAEMARTLNPSLGLVFLSTTPDLRLVGISEKELPYGVQVILKSSVTSLHVLIDGIGRSLEDLKNRNKMRWVSGDTFTDESKFASVLHSLTAVQIETLRLVALGSSNAEIARIRLVTEKAVEHTITRILVALSIASNPRHNARVLLSREYYRWVNVTSKAENLVS